MALSNLDFSGLQALLAEQGLELVLRPVATSATNVSKDVTGRTPTQPVAPSPIQTVTQRASLAPKPASGSAPALATNSAEPSSSIKHIPLQSENFGPGISPLIKPAAKSRPLQRPPVPYSPYQHACRSSHPVQVQNSHSNPSRPPIKLRYMEKPAGTPGRKGKGGWPEPMRYIWGTTVTEYRFMHSIAKRLVYKKLDTSKCLRDQDEDLVDSVIEKFYHFLPEFVEVYGGSKWPGRAFIQVTLKSANEAYKRLAKGINSNLDAATQNSPTSGEDDEIDEDDILAEADFIVVGYNSEDDSPVASVSTAPLIHANGKWRADKVSGSGLCPGVVNEGGSDLELSEPVVSGFNPPQPTHGLVFDYEDEE